MSSTSSSLFAWRDANRPRPLDRADTCHPRQSRDILGVDTAGHHPHRVQLLLNPHPGLLQSMDHIGELAQVSLSHGNLDFFLGHWGDSLLRDHLHVAKKLPGSVLTPTRQSLGSNVI